MLPVAVHRHDAYHTRQVLPHPCERGTERRALPSVILVYEHCIHISTHIIKRRLSARRAIVHHYDVREISTEPPD